MPRRAEPSASEAPHLRIRAYARAAGGCVLLSFPAADGKTHLLLDSGVLVPAAAGGALAALGDDVRRETDGRLDVLAALQGRSAGFDALLAAIAGVKVGELWLPWTEDPGHPGAQQARQRRHRKATALRRALGRVEQGAALRPAMDAVLRSAEIPDADAGGEAGAAPADARVRYLRPGQPPLALRGVGGVRVAVAGRAADDGEDARASIDKQFGLTLEDSFFAALAGLEEGGDDDALLDEVDEDAARLSFPFDEHYRIPYDEAREVKFFAAHYGFGDDAQPGGGGWRKIDQDWMGLAAELALGLRRQAAGALELEVRLGEGGPMLVFTPGASAEPAWGAAAARTAATELYVDYAVLL